jgi:hypothetical protein
LVFEHDCIGMSKTLKNAKQVTMIELAPCKCCKNMTHNLRRCNHCVHPVCTYCARHHKCKNGPVAICASCHEISRCGGCNKQLCLFGICNIDIWCAGCKRPRCHECHCAGVGFIAPFINIFSITALWQQLRDHSCAFNTEAGITSLCSYSCACLGLVTLIRLGLIPYLSIILTAIPESSSV